MTSLTRERKAANTPYNDFAVTNEPLRGDIYVSVPETFAARSISFFATTKKGFVYKVSCLVEPVPAVQVFITNPAIATNKAAGWESETPLETREQKAMKDASLPREEIEAQLAASCVSSMA